MDDEEGRRKRRRLSPPESGPYVLRSVLEDIPLKPEEWEGPVTITCVEYWNDSLYIGTSASEVIHLVALPPDDNSNASPQYILASRLQPSGHSNGNDALGRQGVQQILVLPEVLKACVLCNGTVSFYSLPELSPVFPNREPTGVQWIGGLDENERGNTENPDGPVVMIANSKRILLVRVGEKLRPIKNNIEYPGCLRSSRRDTIACVADNQSYALLEVEHQQKIPLFPISSVPTEAESTPDDSRRGIPHLQVERSPVLGHGRSTSMGDLLGSKPERSQSPRPKVAHPDGLRPSGTNISPQRNTDGTRSVSRQRSSTEVLPSRPRPDSTSKPTTAALKPHVISPFPSEFMLTTGTTENEPGVGMFVNLDGDVVRGTVEFATYPKAILVDNFESDDPTAPPAVEGSEVVIAMVKISDVKGSSVQIEIQKLPGVEHSLPYRFPIPGGGDVQSCGLHKALSLHSYKFSALADLLQSVPLRISESGPNPKPIDQSNKRLEEELKFVQRFGRSASRNLLWSGEKLWQILENPLILQLEFRIAQSMPQDGVRHIKSTGMFDLLEALKSREPRDEVDFLTINYIRQKTSLLLFLHLETLVNFESEMSELQTPVENALHEGALDPRIILLLIRPLAKEVYQGADGIWLPNGIVEVAEEFQSPIKSFEDAPLQFWMMIRHYLTLWQEKRGYGSITDEKLVFDSVDAALLHVLLYLDKVLPRGSGVQTSVRAKLNNVVDHWKGEFDRAIALLEEYNHLFVMSRLYQSKKRAKDVLATWKRIAEGGKDVEYESSPEELEPQIKRYLALIRDTDLVQEYGLWLARRNPSLGVQVFADDSSRVKFTPQQVIPMLKENAPAAVQQYLEYLVFGKYLDKYADDLIGYYLDSVLDVLENSEEARESLAQTYSTYRALTSPKPTYLNFIIENAPSAPWWQSRMRLLQLLGSGGYTTSSSENKELSYSIPKVLERLAPYSSYLVSESIVLDARQGRHKEALRLLVHGLGDFDTAVRYCYFGSPSPSSQTIDAGALPAREVQEELFTSLFHEFLTIEDLEERLERTSQLLGKFATYFDPFEILTEIPDDWTVAMLSEFLLRSFRAATSKRNEAVIVKALSAAQNLQIQVSFVEVCEKVGAQIESEGGIEGEIVSVGNREV